VPRTHKRGNEKGRSWLVVVAALAVFCAFGSLQMILAALNVHLVPVAPAAPASSYGVALVRAPGNPAPVALPATAKPVDADQPPASMPRVNSDREIGLVAHEDARIRMMVHRSVRTRQPVVIQYQGALPTLVLPKGAAAYTIADLVRLGAVDMLSAHVALLQDNLFVAAGAQLNLGAPALSALYMASGANGFASIVGWDGSLSFAGTAGQPFTIMGWNQAAKSAAADRGAGRPYIREIGAAMTLAYAQVSSLGFWSGRTGGVAWTGASRASSTGSAVDSAFTGDTYGAFVSRGKGVMFSADRFESNELDGLHIHRYSVGSRVVSSSSARNGGDGFQVDRATRDTLLRGDVSEHNAANGYLIDGRPLVTGASASGGSNVPSSGTVLENSAATGNGRTSLLIEGGTRTVVKLDQFCSSTTAITLKAGVTNSVLTGNYIGCDPRSGISVGPSAPGTVVFGNIVSRPRIGVLIRDSGPVSLYDNRVIGATVFGASARGAGSRVGGVGNDWSGTGSRAVDARTNASVSALSGTNSPGWSHHARVTFVSYLEFHPLASLWLGILVVILLAAGWSFRRKLPDHPYPASVRRPYPLPAPGESSIAMEPYPAHSRPAAGRPTARLARPHVEWNAPTGAAGRPTARIARPRAAGPAAGGWPPSAPRQQPPYQPGPSYHGPAYREPAPGPSRGYGPPAETRPAGWDRPVQDAPGWQQPRPSPRPQAPFPAPAAGQEMRPRRGGHGDNRALWDQPAPPPEPHRPSGQERPAGPPEDDVRVTRPLRRGVWD
jgi:hypothetical protein